MNGGSNGSANMSSTLGGGSNSQDDLKSGGNNTLGRGHHDPYRFTRSTQQPVDAKMSDYPKYRSVNYFKGIVSKPVKYCCFLIL